MRLRSRVQAGITVRPGRDVDEAAGFPHRDLVPHAPGDDERVARAEVDVAVAVRELEADRHGTGDQVEQFVAVGVDLAVVGCVAGDLRCPDRETVDPPRCLAADLLDEPGLAARAVDADHLAGQIDALTRTNLVRRRHAASSGGSRSRLSSGCSPVGSTGSRTGPTVRGTIR